MKFVQILIITLLLLIIIINCELIEYELISDKEFTRCSRTSVNRCKNFQISPRKGYECCKTNIEYLGYNARILNTINPHSRCSVLSKEIETQDDVDEYECFYKEKNAIDYLFDLDLSEYLSYHKQTYDCPTKNITLYSSLNITDEEKKIIQSENYCQRLYYMGIGDIDFSIAKTNNLKKKILSKEDCFNALILPKSEKYLTCAHVSIKFKLNNGTIIPSQTCAITTKRSFKKNKVDGYLNKNNFSSKEVTIDNVTIDSYEMEIIDKDDNKLSYKHSFNDTDSQSEENQNDN